MKQSQDVLPRDDFNKTLVDNVHPSDWVNPEPSGRYNLVVIGAGTAGLISAAGSQALLHSLSICSAKLKRLFTVKVGSIPHGSNNASGERLTHAARIPKEIAPITSNGLLDISQAFAPKAPALLKK